MSENLSKTELSHLIKTVFNPISKEDKNLAILVDLPDENHPDHEKWQVRRQIAYDWWQKLDASKSEFNLDNVSVICFSNTGKQNADLPETGCITQLPPSEWNLQNLRSKEQFVDLQQLLSQQNIMMAPTEFSATAPLKLAAKRHGFRAATMGGFSPAMVPALRLDWNEVARRVNIVKELLDVALSAQIEFLVDDTQQYSLYLDLRYRGAFASTGLLPNPGTAFNLPSGESYIVPYEGDLEASSLSEGVMPIQFGDEIVRYQIKENRAVEILSDGPKSAQEKKKLMEEPASGNIAELGVGVLRDLGTKPIGETLLDEKLGLHIAFGRSDHFGGATGAKQYNDPANMEHFDWIYIPEMQPRIQVKSIVLEIEDQEKLILRDEEFLIFGS